MKNLNQNNAVSQKHLRHFLDIENLPKSLILDILDLAESFAGVSGQPVKKVPLLRGKTIINLFFEASTRTRTTFELAAKRLSADFLNINIDFSATKKGETLLDTLRNLEAMHCDMFIVRHPSSGAAEFISKNVSQNNFNFISSFYIKFLRQITRWRCYEEPSGSEIKSSKKYR